jgi:hypothetical protein
MSHQKASPLSLTAIAGLALLSAGCSKSNNSTIAVGMSSQISGKNYLAFQSSGSDFGPYYAVAGAGVMGGDTVTLTVYFATPLVLDQQVSSDSNSFARIDYMLLRNNAPYAVYSAANSYGGHACYTITAVDTAKHTIAGSFSGTATISTHVGNLPDSVVITNGAFNISYQ